MLRVTRRMKSGLEKLLATADTTQKARFLKILSVNCEIHESR